MRLMDHTQVDSSPVGNESRISKLELITVLGRRKRLLAVVTLTAGGLALLISLFIPNRYQATVTLLVPQQPVSASSMLSQAALLGAGAGAGAASLLKNPGDQQVAMMKSKSLEEIILRRFDLAHRYRERRTSDALDVLEKNFNIASNAKDGLIRITVTDRDAALAAEMANAYVQEYRRFSANLAVTEATRRRLFFEQQMQTAHQALVSAEEQMKSVEQRSGIIQLDGQSKALIQTGAELRAQIVAKQVELRSLGTYETASNPDVLLAREQLSALQSQLAQMEGTGSSDAATDPLTTKGTIPARGMEYLRRLREVKYNESIFELLAKQYESAKLDEAQQGGAVRVVDPATVPDRKISPIRSLIAILASIAGLIAASLYILVERALRLSESNERVAKQLRALADAWQLGWPFPGKATAVLLLCLIAATANAMPQEQFESGGSGHSLPACSNSNAAGDCFVADNSQGAAETRPSIHSSKSPSIDQIIRINETGPRSASTGQPVETVSPTIVEPLTEFQQMVSESAGKQLSIYGLKLFDNSPSTFAPVDHIPVPENYVIGPGDELVVKLWGSIDLDGRMTVDRNGQIFIPRVGQVTVAGIQYSVLSDRIRSEIGQVFRGFNLSVTLGKLRSVDIYLAGEAKHPGKYTVSSLSTLVNFLFISGGPTNRGTMRQIELRRSGKLIARLDLYDLLKHGDRSSDVKLEPADVVYIPPAGAQIAISGSVVEPGVYELLNSGLPMAEAIAMAGGFSEVADIAHASVERIENHSVRVVREYDLANKVEEPVLQSGDLVILRAILPRFEQTVTLRGNVANPGRYAWHSGLKISDLIPNKDSLVTRGYWQAQNSDPQNRVSQDPHARTVTLGISPRGLEDAGTAARNDQVSRSQRDLAAKDQETSFLRIEINWEYGVIERIDPVDLSTRLIPFSPRKVILERDPAADMNLVSGDIVTFFSQNTIEIPQSERSRFVRIEGEVRSPGIYRAEAGDTLRSLVERAGGITPKAFLFGARFTRESAREQQQEALDEFVRRMQSDLNQNQLQEVRAARQSPGVPTDMQTEAAMMRQLSTIHANGRVVLRMKPIDSSVNDIPQLPLEDGDALLIPTRKDTVSVVGEVFQQSTFLFHQGSTLKSYLDSAGRGTRIADRKRILVIRADGSVISKDELRTLFGDRFDTLGALPGDTIMIPARIQTSAFGRNFAQWTQVGSQLALTSAALAVVR